MTTFGTRFLLCNLPVSVLLLAVLLLRKLSGRLLSGNSRYHIRLLPVILAVPFLPLRPKGILRLFSWFHAQNASGALAASDIMADRVPASSADWIRDFGVSVSRIPAPAAGRLLVLLWILGTLAITIWMIWSRVLLYRLEQSALPLQNQEVRGLYERCRAELPVRRTIPVRTTAFLKSPIIVGCLRPRIYLPIHLITDASPAGMRYIFLHELQHYKHGDAWINTFLNMAAAIYWFNPVVWYAKKEARSDQEIACDASVLQMLNPDERIDYGNTLLNFARTRSCSPLSPVSGIAGSGRQLKKRILNIARYQPCTGWRRVRERLLTALLAVVILESTALIPAAAENSAALPRGAVVLEKDLSSFFSGNEGCFVLYDPDAEVWTIYNKALAARRISPDSTCKIYSALCALENGFITPDASFRTWNKKPHPFPNWNQDQTLASAMKDSVNWYFQSLDQQAGPDTLEQFYEHIDYGNHDLSGGTAEFWLESSLRISAVEQVGLLEKFYTNAFGFEKKNIQAVKKTLEISASGSMTPSGKTGTGTVNGKTVTSWFIGYVETEDNTLFFATSVRNPSDPASVTASRVTLRILEAEQIWR